MTIFATSDLHSKKMIEALEVPYDAEIIVLAGDLEYPGFVFEKLAKKGRPIVAVAGNHDFYNQDIMDGIRTLKATANNFPEVHILENESLVINGIKFIGSTFWMDNGDLHPRMTVESLWNMEDSAYIKAEKWWQVPGNADYFEALHEKVLNDISLKMKCDPKFNGDIGPFLEEVDRDFFHPIIAFQLNQKAVRYISEELTKPFEGNKKVVITHHPPTYELLSQMYNKATISPDDYNRAYYVKPGADYPIHQGVWPDAVVVANYGGGHQDLFSKDEHGLASADAWIHGHTHTNFEYAVCGTRFIVNALVSPQGLEKVEAKEIVLSDGLLYAFDHPVARLVDSIDDLIRGYKDWAECAEIDDIKSKLIKKAVLDKLEADFSRLKEALSTFVARLNSGLGERLSPHTIHEMFGVHPNGVEFSLPLIEEMDSYGINHGLTVKHVEEVIEKLEKIRAKAESKDWLLSDGKEGQ